MSVNSYPFRILSKGVSISNRSEEIIFPNINLTSLNRAFNTTIIAKLGPPHKLLFGNDFSGILYEEIKRNSENCKTLYSNENNEYLLKLHSFEENHLKSNLKGLDSDLPQILSELVLIKHMNPKFNLSEIFHELRKSNYMGYDLSQGHKFYEYKIFRLLIDATWRLNNKTDWFIKTKFADGILILEDNINPTIISRLEYGKTRSFLLKYLRILTRKTTLHINGNNLTKLDFKFAI